MFDDTSSHLCHDNQALLPPTEIRWIVHPFVQESKCKSILLILIVLGFGVLVSISFEGNIYGFLTVILLVISLSRYFFPTRFALDPIGITVSHLASRRQMAWSRLKRSVVTPDGIFLSPFSAPHRLDSFRGFYLRFSGNREEVVAFVQHHVQLRSA